MVMRHPRSVLGVLVLVMAGLGALAGMELRKWAGGEDPSIALLVAAGLGSLLSAAVIPGFVLAGFRRRCPRCHLWWAASLQESSVEALPDAVQVKRTRIASGNALDDLIDPEIETRTVLTQGRRQAFAGRCRRCGGELRLDEWYQHDVELSKSVDRPGMGP